MRKTRRRPRGNRIKSGVLGAVPPKFPTQLTRSGRGSEIFAARGRMHYREIRFWENEAEFEEAPYSGDFRKGYYKSVKTPLQRRRAAGHSQGVSRRAAGTDSAKDLWLGVRNPPDAGPPPPVARARLPSRARHRRIPRRHSAAERIFRSRRVPEKARERPNSRALRTSALLSRAGYARNI